MTKCIDVSNHQGVIGESVWASMKRDVPCAMIRSSFTWQKEKFSAEEDAAFDENMKNAIRAGFIIGVYHFSQAKTVKEAEAEADLVIKTIAPYKKNIKLPVAFDCEFGEKKDARFRAKHAAKIGKKGMLDICDAFCNRIRKAGYDAMVYANLNMLTNYISADLSKHCKVWVAQYSTKCDYKKPYYMWQFTSSYHVPGIKRGVDMSYVNDPTIPTVTAAELEVFSGTFPTLPKRGYFKKGDKGVNVRRVQEFLVWCLGVTLAKDGIYGNLTAGAVRTFQEKYNLEVDGIFGKECLKKAKEVKA